MVARRAASWLPPAHTASGTSTANSHFIPDSEVDGRSPVPLRSWREHTGAGVPMRRRLPVGYPAEAPAERAEPPFPPAVSGPGRIHASRPYRRLFARARTQIALHDHPRLAQFRGCRPATRAGPTSAIGLASCRSKTVDGADGASDDDEVCGYGDGERPGRPGRIVHGGGERGGLICCFCFDQQLAVPVAVVAPRLADALPAVQRA